MTEPLGESPDDGASEGPAAAAEPGPKTPKKPRKKGARAPENGEDERPAADEEAPPRPPPLVEGPAFVRSFPDDPELQRLVRAFTAGDYATVRADAEKLAAATGDDDVRAAAKELRRRLDPDPLAKLLVLGAALLLVVLAGYYWSNPHVP